MGISCKGWDFSGLFLNFYSLGSAGVRAEPLTARNCCRARELALVTGLSHMDDAAGTCLVVARFCWRSRASERELGCTIWAVTITGGEQARGEHDDLVIALALACWRAGRGEIGPKAFPLGWV